MKKKAPKGWVKISDFEETTGISAKTITAAIKRGYIPDNFADVVGTSATSPYYLNPQQAAVCWYKSLNSAHPNQRKVRNALAGYIKTFDKAVIEPEPTAKAVATATMTYEDAQLQEKIAKARIAELELQEKEGALVSRERINAQLFAAGKECLAFPVPLKIDTGQRITVEIFREVFRADFNHQRRVGVTFGA